MNLTKRVFNAILGRKRMFKAVKYHSGEVAFTMDGQKWFLSSKGKPLQQIPGPDKSKVHKSLNVKSNDKRKKS
jgi:hypothetical protein